MTLQPRFATSERGSKLVRSRTRIWLLIKLLTFPSHACGKSIANKEIWFCWSEISHTFISPHWRFKFRTKLRSRLRHFLWDICPKSTFYEVRTRSREILFLFFRYWLVTKSELGKLPWSGWWFIFRIILTWPSFSPVNLLFVALWENWAFDFPLI